LDYAPYTWTHVITQTQLLFFSALAFIFLKLTGLYPPELPSINIDAEWTYRRLAPRAVRRAQMLWSPVRQALHQFANLWFERFIAGFYRHYGPESILSRTWLTGSTALAVAILLVAYLLLYYA